MADTFNRSRLEILNSLISRGMSIKYGHLKPMIHTDCYFESRPAVPGDLVKLVSAPYTKWYLGWLIEIVKHPGGNEYHIESIEDQQICRWSNVDVHPLNPKVVSPTWRWCDAQWHLQYWWNKPVPERDMEDWGYRSMLLDFDGDKVTAKLRLKFSDEVAGSRSFENWRKLKKKQLAEAYRSILEEHRARKPVK